MIEKTILDYLKAELRVPVYLEIPPTPPASFCVITRTAGGCENHIRTGMLAIKSYAGTLLAAAALNEQVKTAMEDADMLPAICSCRLNTDYNFPDTTAKRYRYQAVFDVVYY